MGMKAETKTRSGKSSVDHHQLMHAFTVFSQASEQLSNVYRDLQHQVEHLTNELALANGELQRQLAQKENLSQQLSLLLSALPGGVVAIDNEGVIESANPVAISILGEPLLQCTWKQILEDRLLATDIPNEWNLKRGLDNNFRRISIESSVSEDSGKMILLIQDITEAYANQERIRREQRLAVMGRMAANLAHQLRTPLSTALIYATHLSNSELSAQERSSFAVKTIERLQYLNQLINSMLRFVKGEIVKKEVVNIANLLSDIQSLLLPQMLKKNLKLIVEDNSEGLILTVNYEELCSSLVALLENAMQASPMGSNVLLTCNLTNDEVLFTVIDQGSGIDISNEDRLFEPFFTTRSEGTGLGLAIVHSAIKQMGGDVEVKSLVGEGTEFIIRLPKSILARTNHPYISGFI